MSQYSLFLTSDKPGTPIVDCQHLLWMKYQETVLKTAEPFVTKSMASYLKTLSTSRPALECVQVRLHKNTDSKLL